MFWIHGGGLLFGSNSVPIYYGAELAKKGIVFVDVNYRLGIVDGASTALPAVEGSRTAKLCR